MALTAAARKYLETLGLRLATPPTLRVVRNERPESRLFDDFVQIFTEAIPGARVVPEEEPEPGRPGLILASGWRFHGVPEGTKLEMLGEILLALDGQGPELAPELRRRWENLPLAPELTLFIAPQCPFCPQMVRQLLPLARVRPTAAVTLIDASLFVDLARQDEIKAVPTAIVNGVYRLTGAFTLADLLDLAEKTDPAQLPAAVLERMLQEGQAILVGSFMLDRGLIFANFLPLVWHPEINIRLGAMVALETVGERQPELVAGILPRLWERYADSDLTVRGDIAYLLGEWGGPEWTAPLQAAVAAATEPELVEIIEEALEKVRNR